MRGHVTVLHKGYIKDLHRLVSTMQGYENNKTEGFVENTCLTIQGVSSGQMEEAHSTDSSTLCSTFLPFVLPHTLPTLGLLFLNDC